MFPGSNESTKLVWIKLRELVTTPEPAKEPTVGEYPLKFRTPLTVTSVELDNAVEAPSAIVPELPIIVAPV